MEGIISSFDDAILVSIYNLADSLNCTPVDVLDFILSAASVIFVIFGIFFMIFLDYFLCPVAVHAIDRFCDGLVALVRWFRSRRKNDM